MGRQRGAAIGPQSPQPCRSASIVRFSLQQRGSSHDRDRPCVVVSRPAVLGEVRANLDAIAGAAERAADAGASILVTPEMSATGYDIGDLVDVRAEPADGPIYESFSSIARTTGVAIVYGYPESADGESTTPYRWSTRTGRRWRGTARPICSVTSTEALSGG